MSSLTEQSVASGQEGSPRLLERVLDKLGGRSINVLTALGFGLPIAGYFWIVERYSVNVIVVDQWSDVTVIKASSSHLIPWGVWASSGLTDIQHQGHSPGKDVQYGDHGTEEAPCPLVVHPGVQG